MAHERSDGSRSSRFTLPGQPKPKYADAVLTETICRAIIESCLCGADCLERFSVAEIRCALPSRRDSRLPLTLSRSKMRQQHCYLNEVQRGQWLLNLLRSHWDRTENIWRHFVLGREVCSRACSNLYGIALSRFYDYRNLVTVGTEVIVHGNSLRLYATPKHDVCLAWLKKYISNICDFMPHLQIWYLPVGLTRQEVYGTMTQELTKSGFAEEELSSYSAFLTYLRESFPLVREARSHKLGRCDYCESLELKEEAATTAEARQVFREQRLAHLSAMSAERELMMDAHLFARSHPEEVLDLIIDHANGIRLPHKHRYPKSLGTIIRPRAEVFGAIDAGQKKSILIPHLQIFPHNASLTISLIFELLLRKARERPLPLDLRLQGDNCAKENKNRILFGFLLSLVGLRVFRAVYLEMLPQGHTHAEIDALFSWISRGLEGMDVGSLTELISAFLPFAFKHQRNQPEFASMPDVRDWASWLEPNLRAFEGLSEFRSFKFEVLIVLAEFAF